MGRKLGATTVFGKARNEANTGTRGPRQQKSPGCSCPGFFGLV